MVTLIYEMRHHAICIDFPASLGSLLFSKTNKVLVTAVQFILWALPVRTGKASHKRIYGRNHLAAKSQVEH